MSNHEENRQDGLELRKLIGLLGLAMRAGALAFGTERVCDEIRRHGFPAEEDEPPDKAIRPAAGLALLASDASDNVKKRVVNACRFYHIEWVETGLSAREIGDGIGKPPTAACAVFDRGFERGIRDRLGIQRKRANKSRKDA